MAMKIKILQMKNSNVYFTISLKTINISDDNKIYFHIDNINLDSLNINKKNVSNFTFKFQDRHYFTSII